MTQSEQNELALLDFRMRLLQAEIRMQGMIAENRKRESMGFSPAYLEEDFLSLIDEYSIHANALPSLY
jgi:hypothetical protein